LFADLNSARAAFSDDFEGADLDTILSALQPCIRFVPLGDASPVVGGTRIGGLPDLGPNVRWPIRPAAPNAAEIASFGGSNHNEHIYAHISRDLPFVFLAQIDLREAAALGDIVSALPSDGRLLVFCDVNVVPWNNGAASCHVIWDRSDASDLKEAAFPDALKAMADQFMIDLAKSFKDHGMEMPSNVSAPYAGLSRPMSLARGFVPIARGNLEAEMDASFSALMADEEAEDAYYDAVSSLRFDHPGDGDGHQCLGPPLPEQDDPRYHPALALDLKFDAMTPAIWAANSDSIIAAARDWLLLLQIRLSDFFGDPLSEGMIYIFIRRADLERRDFSSTFAVYQQT
jgi:hypothetical protein